MRLTNNFYLKEFECHCGCDMPRNVMENVFKLSDTLQFLRNRTQNAIRINSAYRCESHNKSIGSNSTSQHVLGKAADITIGKMKPKATADLIERLMDEEVILQGGLGRYNTFTHIDIRGTKARWDNTKK
jgi:uncharacterized protein YcbK (DUF882 family)